MSLDENSQAIANDTVCFRKDTGRQYLSVNASFARLVGLDRREDVVGHTTADFFSPELVKRYDALDRAVTSGTTFIDRFDETHDPDGTPVWWLYSRRFDPVSGSVIGRSRRLPRFSRCSTLYGRLAQATEIIAGSLDQPLRIGPLAEAAGCSVAQLDRNFIRILGASPTAYQSRLRIRRAKDLIDRGTGFSDVALECGFADQSAFNRRFKRSEGMTPGDYRRRLESRFA